jgi:hypothetical protein
MFWGFKLGGSYDWYSMESGLWIDGLGENGHGGGFNASLLFGYDFGLLALQGEVLFNTGWNGYNYHYDGLYGYGGEEHLGFDLKTLQIPVMLKLDLHGNRIMFQPQLGFYLNFGLGDMRYNHDAWGSGPSLHVEDNMDYSSPLFGFMAGGAFGVRIGRGYLFLDIRYAENLGNIKVEGIEMKRHAVMSSLGYQYYFRSKQ